MWNSMPSCIPTSQINPDLPLTKNLWLFILLGMAATSFLASCEKGPAGLGSEVLPLSDRVEISYTDTIPLRLETISIDSISTYQATRQLFGNYFDPFMGHITAQTFTQVFPRSALSFGDASELVFDSLVLSLDLESAYGRLDQEQILRVFQITDTWPDTNQIFSTSKLNYDPDQPLGTSPVRIGSNGLVTVTRIRLDEKLGNQILFGDPSALANRDRFIAEILSGFVFDTEPVKFFSREPGAIFTLFSNSQNTQLELHYHKFDSTLQTFTRRFEAFPIFNSTPRFHSLQREGAEDLFFGQEHGTPDTFTRYEFLQSGLLQKVWVRFPQLDVSEVRLVSKAELILPVDVAAFGTQNRYAPPLEIIALRSDENGEEIVVNGLGTSVSSSTGALTYSASRRAYVIPITAYMQRLFNETWDLNGFVIVPSGARSSVSRAVLGGVNHPDPAMRPRLELTTGSVPR